MTYCWEPGTQYDAGSVVEYQGHKYKIIQPHQSQSGWEPPNTPALWARLPEEYHEHHEHHDAPPSQQQGGYYQPPQQGGYGGGYGEKPQQYPQQQPPPPQKEEDKSGWDGLSEERKKQLEIGGGLLAGAAAIGAGIFAYKKHEEHEEDKQSQAWSAQNWLQDAEQRTRDYYQNGPRGPATWLLVHGKDIPTNIAIPGGEEHGERHYICRAFHKGSIQLGKASSIFKEGGVLGYAHDEIHVSTFEVLVGDMRALKWVPAHGRLNLENLGARPVEGGREADGTPLYIAQAHTHNAIVPGKCSTKLDAAFVPYGNTEKEKKDYRVLCYA
ncbi:carbohydrate-binding module family 12 protein [Trametes elegans]|nr:carbohydrate-binding module family 12 protein [Trametes elegans]